MVHGMIGKKIGMVQIFDESGHAMGVTVVEAGPCKVIQTKGQSRVQLGYGGGQGIQGFQASQGAIRKGRNRAVQHTQRVRHG